MNRRLLLSAAWVAWLALILTLFFVVQKPVAGTVARGLASLVGTVLLGGLFAGAGTSIGYLVLAGLQLAPRPSQRLILAAGLGMGMLGLLGFGLAAAGIAQPWVMIGLLTGILLGSAVWKRAHIEIAQDSQTLWQQIREAIAAVPAWIKSFALALGLFSFLLALAPPIEAFDGLFYHLTVPSLWLRDGVELVNMPHYWFPALMEGMFVWPLSVNLDSTPHLIHFVFGVLSILLVLDWTRSLFGNCAAGWTIAVFLSMPSLPWLAAWAYTDLGLIYFSLGALLAVSNWRETTNHRWLAVAGMMTGFAMGIKYTSFVLPLVIFIFLVWRGRNNLRKLAAPLFMFSVVAFAVGFPWYLRNWLWMGNPFYPFLFGGPFWDEFRARWYAGAGTGIGWSLPDLVALPFVTTLGHRDANYYDGRIGPLYLALFPLMMAGLWRSWKQERKLHDAQSILLLFSLASITFWTFGVIQTDHLMQARLLWPGLIPLIPFMAAGIPELVGLDSAKFRISFVFSTLAALTIFAFLLDFALLVAVRNPIRVAIGSETRQAYTARIQPSYAEVLKLVNAVPADAFIYMLNEQRSYDMTRRVQPDPINDNLAHDFYVYHTNVDMLSAWRSRGYTHVLVAKTLFQPEKEGMLVLLPDYESRLQGLLTILHRLDESDKGNYVLYKIPQP